SFNPVRTVGAQIVEVLELHEVAEGTAARARTGRLLESVGIPADRARRFPHEFSGGMRQRAAIAMALACEPSVLVADEPTTALDVMVQAQILELLDGLCRDFGLALVLVTHDLPVVAQLCDRAAVMYAGEIVEEGRVGSWRWSASRAAARRRRRRRCCGSSNRKRARSASRAVT